MNRLALAIGTRAEVIAELDDLGKDAVRAGKEEKARVFAAALAAVESGDSSVVVLRRKYEITD